MPTPQLFLVDAHALCYRSYYAIKGLSTGKGQATNAVYGFLATLRKILREYNPEYVAVCFDVGEKTHRKEKFSEYKIHRPLMPDDLVSQIPIIKEVVQAYNLPIFELGGFEADDIIATIAHKMKRDDLNVVIVSEDKDMCQLVDEKVRLFSARKDKLMNPSDVKNSLGFDPQYIPDYIGLAGDKTDNIPGVAGIGDVTAKKLINQHGTLENIFAHMDELKSQSVRDKLTAEKEMAFFSKELAVLDTNTPVDVQLKDMHVREPDKKRLFEIFSDLEFKKLAAELSEDIHEHQEIKFREIKTAKDAQDIATRIGQKKQFAFLMDFGDEQEGSFLPKHMVVDLGEDELFCVDSRCVEPLKSIFEDKGVVKITCDLKEKLRILQPFEWPHITGVFDVMLAGYLLAPSRSTNDVKTLAWDYLKTSIPETDRWMRETQVLIPLYELLQKELAERSLAELLETIEIPLAYVLFRMEAEGVKLDEKLLKKLSGECEEKISVLMKELFDLAGEPFNLNSPKQLSHVLFEKLGLPVVKKTKTGFSTKEEVLTKLAAQHPLPALILEYRHLAKLKSTYLDALPKLVNSETGKIHASFNQAGTETGRLSSSNPNLQNIPVRTDLGRRVRKAFVPSKKENLLIAADYSQIELRILAHLSKDKNLMNAFKNDQDIHQFTAALILDLKEEDVTPEMRNSAKRVNFGIIYGMSAFGLAKDLNIPQGEAQDFIDKYFLRYPGVKTFMDETIKKCEEDGFVITLLNRRRYIPEINSSNMSLRQFAQRQAINTPVQGSAADLIKLAMINIQKEFDKQKMNSKMIITVHDELVFDVIPSEEKALVDLVRDQMEHTLSLSVPTKVVIKKGKNWLEMEKV